jgi:hypothetical protein
MSNSETLGIHELKLPELSTEDIKAVGSFLPGKFMGRCAAFVYFLVLCLAALSSLNSGLRQFMGAELPVAPWLYYGLLIGVPAIGIVAQLLHEGGGRPAASRAAGACGTGWR